MESKRIELIDKIKASIADKSTETDVLQAAIELIDSFSSGFNWSGFYMIKGDILEVGPYIGPKTPHTKIELGSGICGAAATQLQSIVVDDVNADSRFLACSITTKSEIVVPLMDGDKCLGEIDIDSNQAAFFSENDKLMLEDIAWIIVKKLKELS